MIKFVNIKTGEEVAFTVDQDPEVRQAHMAAYLNSSNLHANSSKGQDFGWRLAPEVVAEMDKVRTSPEDMDTLTRRIGISADDVRDFHVLNYVADRTFAREAMARSTRPEEVDYEKEYNKKIEDLRAGKQPISEESDSAKETDSAKMPVSKSTNQEK